MKIGFALTKFFRITEVNLTRGAKGYGRQADYQRC